jgi:hypothetical protein
MKKTTLAILAALVIGVTGCGGTKMHKLQLGMSQDEVRSAIGQPKNVVEARAYANKKVEVWEYKAGKGAFYRVYFTDGKVDSWRRGY